MEEQIQQLNERIKVLEDRLNGVTNDTRQVDVIRDALSTSLQVKRFGLDTTPEARQSAISDPTGGLTIDSEARSAVNSLISRMETFGFIST